MPRSAHRTSQILFIGSTVLVVAAPVLVGSVHPQTQAVLAAGALVLAAVGVFHWRRRGMSLPAGAPFWILAGLSVAVALQLTPLPAGLRRLVDPEGYRLISPVVADVKAGVWPAVVWDAPAGVMALLHHLSCAAVLLAVCGVCRNRNRALLMVWTVDIAFLAIAFFSAIHLFSRASRIWWIYKPLWWEGFMTPFVNQNHAAALFVVSACLHVGLCFTVTENRKRWALVPLAALPGFLVVQSHSRSAFVGLLIGLLVFFVLMRVQGTLQKKTFWQVLLLAGLALTALLPSVGMLRRSFGAKDTTTLSANQKVQAWKDGLSMVRRHPLVGVGRGSYQVAFTRYKRFAGNVTVTHAENLVLQIAAEMGVIVLLALLAAAGVFLVGYVRETRFRTLDCAALAALVGLFVQNLADFNLEFPGTAFVAMALLGLLTARHMDRRSGDRSRNEKARGRLAPYVGASVLVAGGAVTTVAAFVWAVPHSLRAEAGRVERALDRHQWDRAAKLALNGVKRHPADYYLHLLAGYAEARARKSTPLKWLNHALRFNPSDYRAHLVSASVLAELGRPYHAADEYRNAFELGANLSRKRILALLSATDQIRTHNAIALRSCDLAWRIAGLSSAGSYSGVFHLVDGGVRRLETRYAGVLLTLALPGRAEDWHLLARQLRAEKRSDDMAAVLEVLVDAWPSQAEALGSLVKHFLASGRALRAYEWARWLLEASTADSAFYIAAQAAQAASGDEVAFNLLQRGITVNPYSALLAFAAARMALRRGDLDEARRIVRRRLRLGALNLSDRARLHGIVIEAAERARGKGADETRLKYLDRRLLRGPGRRPERLDRKMP